MHTGHLRHDPFDLRSELITTFPIDTKTQRCVANSVGDIGMTLSHARAIERYESKKPAS